MKYLQIRDDINNILYIVSDYSRYHSKMTIFFVLKKEKYSCIETQNTILSNRYYNFKTKIWVVIFNGLG